MSPRVALILSLALSLLASERAPADESWSIGGDSENEFALFGEIKDILRLPDGRTAILDAQQQFVRLFDPAGNHLATIEYEGAGPGEVRNAVALVPFPPGRISVVQARPPKLAVLGVNGAEPTDWKPGLPEEMQNASIVSARSNGRVLVLKLYFIDPTTEEPEEVLRLARWSDESASVEFVGERRESTTLIGGVIHEYSAPDELDVWDVDEQGRLLVAPEVGQLAVEIWAGSDTVLRRDLVPDYERVSRSADRYDEIRGRYERMLQFVPGARSVDVSRFERDVRRLAALPDGGYVVVPSSSYNPDGTPGALSLFRWSADGRRLADIETDAMVRPACDLFWISGGYVYVVTGGRSAAVAARRGDAMGNAIIGDGPCGADVDVADMSVQCRPVLEQ